MIVGTGELALAAHRALLAAGTTVATAESLTGGLLGAALTDLPGSSAYFRGGVQCYATQVKRDLLGVPAALLDAHGPVSRQCAAAMAGAVRVLVPADVGVATTGVAGPDRQGGHPPGTVYVAVASGAGVDVRRLALPGDRDTVRLGTVHAALELLLTVLGRDANGSPPC